MELSEIIGGILMGIGIGFVVLGLYIWILFQRIKGRVDDMVDQIIQEAESNLVGLDIELDKDTYFCYNSKDKQFICQGKAAAMVVVVASVKPLLETRPPARSSMATKCWG